MKFHFDPAPAVRDGADKRIEMILRQPDSACGAIRLRADAQCCLCHLHPCTNKFALSETVSDSAGSSFVHVAVQCEF